MTRIPRTGIAAGLLVALAACTPFRQSTPGVYGRIPVPVVLASLTTGEPGAESFSVTEVGPSGTVPHENLEGGIWVLFNKPVVALKSLDAPASSSALSISPRVEGIYRWYGSRLLAFEPRGQLAPATEYTISVAPGLRSLAGEALRGDTDFSFRTEPLDIVSVTPAGSDVPPESSKEIIVTFNFPVDLKTITPSLRLEAGGAGIAFKTARPAMTGRVQLGPYENADRLVSVVPARDLPWNTDITVRVLAGAKPRPENYGSEAEVRRTFHTLEPLAVEDSSVDIARSGATVRLRFNHPLKQDTVEQSLEVEASGYTLGNNVDVSGSWVSIRRIPAGYDSSVTIRLLRSLADAYGQFLGTDRTVSLDVGPAPAYVSFRGTGQKVLESQFPPKVAVEMQNVDQGRTLAARISSPFAARPTGPFASFNARGVPRNTRHFEIFDLAPFLDAGKGAAYLSWSFSGMFYESDELREESDDLVVQVTDIGAALTMGYNSLVVAASSLATGAPIADAAVTFRRDAATIATGRTDGKGVAALSIPAGTLQRTFGKEEQKAEIEIVKGKDRLILRPSFMPGRTWNAYAPFSAEEPRPLTYIWSDRGIYRPAETISFAGFDRDMTLGKLLPVRGKFRVDLVNGSDEGAPVASVSGTTSVTGSFSGRLALPKAGEPGDWLLVYRRVGGPQEIRTGSAFVQVANFRRAAFSVDLRVPGERRFMGDTLDAVFSGAYLAGGTVTRGSWSWYWTRRETWYQPPGEALSGYSFGDVQKGWPEDMGAESGALSGDGVTTATGMLSDAEKGRVYSYEITATVEDVDRQAISKTGSSLVFTSQQLLGAMITADARSNASLSLVEKGQPFSLKVASVDPDGKPLASGTVTGKLLREEWTLVREASTGDSVDTHYELKEVVERTFSVRPGQTGSVIALTAQKAGSYAVELDGQDSRGRPSYTRIGFYSTGSDQILWERSDERRIEIVPDRKIYNPGDTARLLIKSPVANGTFLVTVEREGILDRRTVELSGSAPTIDVPISQDHVPIVYVSVATALGRSAPPPDGPDTPDFGKPRGYSGLVELPVETRTRTIALTITNGKDSYLPGSEATVTIKATLNGAPVSGAEIALVAADRGVLDLIDYRIPSPVDFFYSRGNFPDRVSHFDSRDMLLDPVTWKADGLPGGDEKGESAPGVAGPAVRKNFEATALFRTGIVTGKDGTATVKFTLPDSLTRFRTTAVAAKDAAFGIAEGEILVQNPINVRAALPRRMRIDDRVTAGVVLTNLDARSHAVSVGLAASVLAVQGPKKKSLTLKPGETAEVAFDLAASTAGRANLGFSVDSDILREKLESSLDVVAEHVNESVTIVGKTTDLAREALTVPAAFLGTSEEGLYLTLDSTIASSLAGAIRFLDIYPYDCLEQVTSKLFSRVLFPTLAGGAADLGAIARFANPDGGFSYWDVPAPRRSNYYVSLRVAHLLSAAMTRGLRLPAEIDTAALLGYIDKGWKDQGTYLQSYALYVSSAWGKKDAAKTAALARQADRIGVVGYGFLGLAYNAMGDAKNAAAVLARLKNFVRPGTRTVTLVGTVDDWLWYGGDLQAKALLLMLYARVQPDSQLVLGLANDLLASSGTGYWGNTSNAGWVLQGFAELMSRGAETNADFTGTVRLGNAEVARRAFKGFSKLPLERQVPAEDLTAIAGREKGQAVPGGRLLPLSFGVAGKGTLYYTAELRSSLAAGSVPPRDEGIGIAADILDDRGALVQGTSLALGKVYTMKIVFYSSQDRTSLAVRAPLPSGAEPIDGSLATSQRARPTADQSVGSDSASGDTGSGYEGDYGGAGYTTRVYDSEVRFFFEELSRGKHELSFLFRTTTPGVFPTPPVQAELMYQPEVFGRTGGTVYRIVGQAER